LVWSDEEVGGRNGSNLVALRTEEKGRCSVLAGGRLLCVQGGRWDEFVDGKANGSGKRSSSGKEGRTGCLRKRRRAKRRNFSHGTWFHT